MKICRFNDTRIGIVEDQTITDISDLFEPYADLRYPVPLGDQLIRNLDELLQNAQQSGSKRTTHQIGGVVLNSPVANPSKIIGTPSNYMAHRIEAGADREISVFSQGKRRSVEEQGLFLKANSSLVGPGEGIVISLPERRTDHEAEIGVVIGRKARNIDVDQSVDYIAGYAMAMDIVVRGPEDRSFRKSLDTYSLLGPWLVTRDEVPDHNDISFKLMVNGEVRQEANTSEMLMNINKQIAWASTFYTLYPGDIIMTGTCQGVGPLKPGDVIEMEADYIGKMTLLVN